MLDVLRAALRLGKVTTPYAGTASVGAPGYRGRPRLAPDRCTCNGACVSACPSGVISLESSGERQSTWRLDLAACVFCGLCQDACPEKAIELTNELTLATNSRENLVDVYTVQGHLPDVEPRAHNPLQSMSFESDHIEARIRSKLGRSLHIRHVDTGSDNSSDWEIATLLGPVYDVQRLGIDFVASPRHADMLLVTGPVTRNLELALLATYEAMPGPKLVVAVGDEACGGGLLQGSYAVRGGVDKILPVDVFIPGSPPPPTALIHGILLALGRAEPSQPVRL